MTRRIGRWLLVGLVLGLGLAPAISRGAPLVTVQILARLDGTDNAFSSTIAPTATGQEYDYIVVATLAPAGTVNANLPVDPGTGTSVINSWQSAAGTTSTVPITDGLQGLVYAAYEAPTASTQISFQSGPTTSQAGFEGAGGNNTIDGNIFSGVFMKRSTGTGSQVNGEAIIIGGVNTSTYTYTSLIGQQATASTTKPNGLVQSAAGYVLFNNYGIGSGASPGFTASRGNGNNDLVRAVPIGPSGPAGYYGINANTGTSGQTATNEKPYTVILADGSNLGGPTYGSAGGDPNGNDSTFVVNSIGAGTSALNLNYQDFNSGTPGGGLTQTTNILNIAYHNSAGTYIQAGISGSFQLSAQTGSDPVIAYVGLTIVGSVASGNTSVLNFQPNTGSFGNVLTHGTVTVSVNLNNTPGNGTDVGSYTGVTNNNGMTGPATGTANPGNNSVSLTLNNNANGSGTPGAYSGTYTIINTSTGSTDTGGNKTITMSAQVGSNAGADTSNSMTAFGPSFGSTQVAGSSFAGLGSTVGGSSSGPILGGAIEHTTATIVQGQNNSGGTDSVSMSWRARTLNETSSDQGGTPTSPPLKGSLNPLVSDVVNLSLGETNPTSVFALQMNYDPNLDQQPLLQSLGLIYLGWLNPNGLGAGVPEWQNAVNGNFGQGATVDANVNSSYAAWALANGVTDANVGNFLGSWGVDLADHEVWAVLNHNSQFAVVPEPATIVLGAFGLLGLLGVQLRKKS